jgi:hypothetical protein
MLPLRNILNILLIVLAPDDYDQRGEVGGMSGRGNRSTRRKLPQCCLVYNKSHMALPGPPPWEAGD